MTLSKMVSKFFENHSLELSVFTLCMVNLKGTIAYLFPFKGDIMLFSLFSCYYNVFKLKAIGMETLLCDIFMAMFSSQYLTQFWFDAELQSVNGAVKDRLKRYGDYDEEVK